MVREECCGEYAINGNFRRTAHERCQQDGHASVPFRRQGSCCHNCRNSTAETDQQRYDTSAGQTDLSQQFVHHESNTRHITCIFQNRQEEEQNHDDRQETEYTAHTSKHTIDNKTMYHRVDAVITQSSIHHGCDSIDACRQQVTQVCTDHIECQIENQEHYTYKNRQRQIFMCQNTVDLHTSHVFFTFLRFDNRSRTYFFNKVIAHIRQSCVSVHIMFFFHLDDAVFDQFQFVLIQIQFFRDIRIAFDQFCSCKTHRDTCFFRMVFDLMAYGMDASVNGACRTEVIYLRIFSVLCRFHSHLHQFIDTFIFHRTDGNHRNA